MAWAIFSGIKDVQMVFLQGLETVNRTLKSVDFILALHEHQISSYEATLKNIKDCFETYFDFLLGQSFDSTENRINL